MIEVPISLACVAITLCPTRILTAVAPVITRGLPVVPRTAPERPGIVAIAIRGRTSGCLQSSSRSRSPACFRELASPDCPQVWEGPSMVHRLDVSLAANDCATILPSFTTNVSLPTS